MTRSSRLLVLWFVLVALGTMHPFVLDWRPVVVPSDSFFVPRFKALDPPFNLLMFMPLGAVLARHGYGKWSVGVAGFVVSVLIELAQHYIAFRVPVLEDVAFNTGGALLGAVFAGPVFVVFSWLGRRRVRVGVFVLTTAVVMWSAAPPVVSARLWRWAETATLVVGHEQPGNYVYGGEVHRASLWVGVHPPNGSAPPVWTSSITADGPTPKFARRIEAAGAFTAEVDITPPNKRDAVLRRIFTYSAGVQRRNFMVAARDDELVFRVRTRVTPIIGLFPDGEEPLTIDAPVVRSTVRITYETGELRAYVDGRVVEAKLLVLAPHNGARTFWLPRSWLGVWLWAFSAGLVVAAGAVGFVDRRRAFLLAVGIGVGAHGLQMILFSGVGVGALIPLILGAAFGVWAAR